MTSSLFHATLHSGYVYNEIISNLFATGFLSLAFGSGILFQRVRSVKEDLDKFIIEQNSDCNRRHEGDDEVLKAITKLSTQVETLIHNHEEFKTRVDRALEKKARNESN